MPSSTSAVAILADHSIVDTAPFFVPALLAVALFVGVLVRDRVRQRRGEGDAQGSRREEDGQT